MDSDGSSSDFLEDDGGQFEGQGDVSLGTDSELGGPLLVLVLNHKHGLVEGTLVSALSQNSLNGVEGTSSPYLILSSCLAMTLKVKRSKCLEISSKCQRMFLY